ncbi:MAG: site-specific integrase [Deltaproteobacteria bacterium]|nr:site-specific integrase [Deltaproteobacteria bacterium]
MPFKRENKWVGQIRVNGKKYRQSFQTKQEAIAWEVKKKKSLKQTSEPETPTVCLIDWATRYLDYAKIKFVVKTFDEKKSMFKRFFSIVPADLLPSQLTSGLVLSYLQKQSQNRSGYAANKDRKNMVAAWNWGIKYINGFSAFNPCLVDRFSEVRKPRYVPPENDFWKVYEVAENDQDRVILLAFLQLAARKKELFNLAWEDVDFVSSRVRIYTRKRKDGSLEYDWLPLLDELKESFLMLRKVNNSDWVFPDPETGFPYIARFQWMRRLCDKAGVKRFGIHSIRHLSSSLLARSNVAMIDIQSILRHKNLATTERYIKRINSLRPALKVLAGRNKKPSTGALKQKKELAFAS